MKATGIIRRIDDLGRVVIPKEIRRTLRIQVGDPLEIFLEGETVSFKKYYALGNADWQKIRSLLECLISRFCLLNRYGEYAISSGVEVSNFEDAISREDVFVYTVAVRGENIGHLVVDKSVGADLVKVALKQFELLLKDAGEDF